MVTCNVHFKYQGILIRPLISDEFKAERNKHWGRERITRTFLDNTQTGQCPNCGQYPASKEESFFMLQLPVPRSVLGVSLSSVLSSHYSESSWSEEIKCSYCCTHDRQEVACPLTGLCRRRQATEHCQLVEAPQYLLMQLMRYDRSEQKIQTFVKVEEDLILPSGDQYELSGILNHIGSTQRSGHFVTYLKIDGGE